MGTRGLLYHPYNYNRTLAYEKPRINFLRACYLGTDFNRAIKYELLMFINKIKSFGCECRSEAIDNNASFADRLMMTMIEMAATIVVIEESDIYVPNRVYAIYHIK